MGRSKYWYMLTKYILMRICIPQNIHREQNQLKEFSFIGKQVAVKPTLWKVWMMKMISEELFPELALRYLKKPVVLLRRYGVILTLVTCIQSCNVNTTILYQ